MGGYLLFWNRFNISTFTIKRQYNLTCAVLISLATYNLVAI